MKSNQYQKILQHENIGKYGENIEITSILCNTATWKYWKICMENIEIKSVLENTTTWIMVIFQICPNMLAMRGYVDLSCIVKTFMIS